MTSFFDGVFVWRCIVSCDWLLRLQKKADDRCVFDRCAVVLERDWFSSLSV